MSFRTQFIFLIIVLKCSFDLYHSIKRFGFSDYTINNISIIVFIAILYILDIIFDRKGRSIPNAIILILLGILLIAILLTSIL